METVIAPGTAEPATVVAVEPQPQPLSLWRVGTKLRMVIDEAAQHFGFINRLRRVEADAEGVTGVDALQNVHIVGNTGGGLLIAFAAVIKMVVPAGQAARARGNRLISVCSTTSLAA